MRFGVPVVVARASRKPDSVDEPLDSNDNHLSGTIVTNRLGATSEGEPGKLSNPAFACSALRHGVAPDRVYSGG